MHFERNIEARSCDRCCSTKATSISFSECVFMGTQHTIHVPPVVLCFVLDEWDFERVTLMDELR